MKNMRSRLGASAILLTLALAPLAQGQPMQQRNAELASQRPAQFDPAMPKAAQPPKGTMTKSAPPATQAAVSVRNGTDAFAWITVSVNGSPQISDCVAPKGESVLATGDPRAPLVVLAEMTRGPDCEKPVV